jgi:hypothetical protein
LPPQSNSLGADFPLLMPFPIGENPRAPQLRSRRREMQHGSLIKSVLKFGPDVWQFRWSEKGPQSRRIYRRRVIGTVEDYRDMDCARRAVVGLLSEINSDARRVGSNSMTFAQLCSHFEQRELAKDNTWRSYSTKNTYRVYLKRWVVPHWGNMSYPRSRQSKSNLGFAVCPSRKAVVQRSETSCPFCLIMLVDMSFLTAVRFAWSGRARNAALLRACDGKRETTTISSLP